MRRALVVLVVSIVVDLGCRRPSGDGTTMPIEECATLDGGNADDCYGRLATKTSKPGYCDRIVGPHAKNECFERLAPVVDDDGLCAKIDEAAPRAGCFAAIAKKRMQVEPCKKIDKVEVQAICIKDVAIAKKDVTLCDGLTVVTTQLDCVSTLAKPQPDLCERLTDKETREQCFARASSAPDAPKDVQPLCDRVSDVQLRNNCWTAAAGRKDPLLCDKIAEAAPRLSCIRGAVLIAPLDESTCAKLGHPEDVDDCLVELAKKKHDAAPCETIRAAARKDACLLSVARALSDPTICSRLTNAEKKARCVEIKDSGVTALPPLAEIQKGVTRVSPTEFTVSRRTVDLLFDNAPDVMRTMRFVPELEGGRPVGVRVFGVRPTSIGSTFGIENGDRVERINGFDVTAPEKALEVYPRLRTAEKIVLEMKRRGEPLRMVYTVH